MFFEFDQNNSGGVFRVDDRVCHRLFIEADSRAEAIEKAEDLGCYWDGVDNGLDCPCCGDRWSLPYSFIGDDQLSSYGVSALSIADWRRKYGRYAIVKPPYKEQGRIYSLVKGFIAFKDIEEYAQYLADEYGFTSPDARIFYKNGTVTEIFSARDKREV